MGKTPYFGTLASKMAKKNDTKNNIFERTPIGASQVPPQTNKSQSKNEQKMIQKTNEKWFKKCKKQQKVIQKWKKSDLEGTFAVQTVLQLAVGKCERPKASRSQPTPQTIQ